MTKPDLKGVVFEVTSGCNLRCAYCYNIHKMPGGPDPAGEGYRRARRTIDRLFSVARVGRVTMTGGEPFLAERFLELALHCRMKGAKVAVITNGTAASFEDLKLLVDAGVTLFEIPIHSDRPDEHDRLTRVEGSWARVMTTVEHLKTLGAHAVPVIVMTRVNLPRLSQTLRLLTGWVSSG